MGDEWDTAQAREAIERVGGLVNTAALADVWRISVQRVHVLVRREGFPVPITHVHGRPVWARVEVDAWRWRQLKADTKRVDYAPSARGDS